MHTDRLTKLLLLFAGTGLWACALFRGPAPAAPTHAAPNTLRAREFDCVDAAGNIRAKLGSEFGPSLDLIDEHGNIRADLSTATNGPSLDLLDEHGNPTVILSSDKDSTVLNLSDEHGNAGAALITSNAGPVLNLSDEHGNPRAQLSTHKDGTTLDLFAGENANDAAILDVTKDGTTFDLFAGENGNTRARLITDKNGPGLHLYDDHGNDRACLGVAQLETIATHEQTTTAPSSLVLFDPNGKVIYEAPSEAATPNLPAPTLPHIRPTAPTLPGLYPATGPGHWIESVSDSGRIVTLEDGSIWEIADTDQIDTILWLPTTSVVVVHTLDPFYPYKLVNTDDGESARARLIR